MSVQVAVGSRSFVATAPAVAAASFRWDGVWRNSKGERNVIRGAEILWSAGDSEPLQVTGPDSFTVGGGEFHAKLSGDGLSLTWSNNFVWTRELQARPVATPGAPFSVPVAHVTGVSSQVAPAFTSVPRIVQCVATHAMPHATPHGFSRSLPHTLPHAAPHTVSRGAPQLAFEAEPAGCDGIDVGKLFELKHLFARFDVDRSNSLHPNELSRVMAECGMPISASSLDAFFCKFDSDRNGKISFAEFMAAFHTPPPPVVSQAAVPAVATDGKFVDVQFPPSNDSILKSPHPQIDGVEEMLGRTNGGQIQWVRASQLCASNGAGKLFNNVHPNDVAQGAAFGDSWLLGALAGLAEFEGAVFHLFEQKAMAEDGKYAMRLYNDTRRTWESVTIDDFIPVSVSQKPILVQPRDNEMWILLAEKAFAKWFGSYVQSQGAHIMVAFLLLTDVVSCRGFSQVRSAQGWDSNAYTAQRISMADSHRRDSLQISAVGMMSAEQVWQELCAAERQNYIIVAVTVKDPELVAADGLINGHAYPIVATQALSADGRQWRALHLRNPWARSADWRGAFGREWRQWSHFPQLRRELCCVDGVFWMSWEDFCARFSEVYVIPKAMEVPRLGSVEATAPHAVVQKHGKKFQTPEPALVASLRLPAAACPRLMKVAMPLGASLAI